jgi:cephalosporin hydroxylase
MCRMSEPAAFAAQVSSNIDGLKADHDLQALTRIWIRELARYRYTYNFTWLGRPIIQFPQDLVAMQEIIWDVRPDLIIETGIAHGGSLVFHASLLELLGGDRRVLGIDIDIRKHNREEIEKHPLGHRIDMIQGSSIDERVVSEVRKRAAGRKSILVALDSNHTHAHVLQELRLYSPLVTVGSYLVVFDTLIEDMPDDMFHDRPWGKGDNPKTAVREFLKDNGRFAVDADVEAKLLITVAPEGYLRRVK